MKQPDVVIRTPDILDDHREWIKNRIDGLKSDGYEWFRVGFPDHDRRDLFIEAWKKTPKQGQTPPVPWEKPDYVPRQVKTYQGSASAESDVCLIDGSSVPLNGVSYTRKRPDGQQTSYVVMTEKRMRELPLKAPLQTKVRHLRCGTATEMHVKMAHTIARDPQFYKALFCAKCRAHFKTGSDGEFTWMNSDQKVGAKRLGT